MSQKPSVFGPDVIFANDSCPKIRAHRILTSGQGRIVAVLVFGLGYGTTTR